MRLELIAATLVFSLLFTGLSVAGEEAEMQFAHLRSEDGLSQNAVSAIVQDDLGFFWFATYDGLDRWDGHHFKRYKHNPFDENSLSSNFINALLIDDAGSIWVGTENGINRIDTLTDTVHRYRLSEAGNENIIKIFQDIDGGIWLNAERTLYHKEPDSDQFAAVDIRLNDAPAVDPAAFSFLLQIEPGTLVAGTRNKGVLLIDLESLEARPWDEVNALFESTQPDVSCLLLDSRKILWVCTWTEGIARYNLNTGEWKQYNAEETILEDRHFSRGNNAVEHQGKIYFTARNNGLLVYDMEADNFSLIRNDPDDPLSLTGIDTFDVMVDKTGALWVSTLGMGVSYSSPLVTYFQQSADLTGEYIYAFADAGDGSLWTGGYSSGLIKIYSNGSIIERYNAEIATDEVMSIRSLVSDSQGRLWVGGGHRGLLLFEEKSGEFTQLTASAEVWDLILDQQENLWMVSNLEEIVFKPADSIEPQTLYLKRSRDGAVEKAMKRTIRQAPDGTFWLGTTQGLYQFSFEGDFCKILQHYRFNAGDTSSIINNHVISLHFRDENTLYAGTRGGLAVLDISSGTFRNYTMEDGLPNNVIYAIIADSGGDIWLTSNRGISRFNPDSEEFTNYFLNNGLQDWEFNTHAIFKHDGRLYFGGVSGINYLDSVSTISSNYRPNAIFGSFKASGVEIGSARFINSNPEIEFTHNQNDISFTIAIDDVHAPQLNRYAYRIDGLDDDWNTVQPGVTPIYHNIPPGDYYVRIRGANDHGIWSENERYVKIRVKPAFYNTAWFRYTLLFGLLGLVSAIVIWRQVLLRRQKETLEEELAVRTGDIRDKNRQLRERADQLQIQGQELQRVNSELETFSYTVSHDLRAPLNTIKGFAELLEEEMPADENQQQLDYLRRIQSGASRMENLISNLLKYSRSASRSVDRTNLSLSLLAGRVLQELSAEYDLDTCTIEIQPDVSAWADEFLVEIVLQNLLHNALKYSSRQERPEISFGYDQQRKSYYVRDNGVGFDSGVGDRIFMPFERVHNQSEFGGTGIGLATVKRIISRHNGKVWAESEPGRGTTIWFTLPDQESAE